MKYKYNNKKERKANGHNAQMFQSQIEDALKYGNETRAQVLYKRGMKRGYNLTLKENE